VVMIERIYGLIEECKISSDSLKAIGRKIESELKEYILEKDQPITEQEIKTLENLIIEIEKKFETSDTLKTILTTKVVETIIAVEDKIENTENYQELKRISDISFQNRSQKEHFQYLQILLNAPLAKYLYLKISKILKKWMNNNSKTQEKLEIMKLLKSFPKEELTEKNQKDLNYIIETIASKTNQALIKSTKDSIKSQLERKIQNLEVVGESLEDLEKKLQSPVTKQQYQEVDSLFKYIEGKIAKNKNQEARQRVEKQIQKVKSEIEQPLMDLQQTLRKYEERCLSEKDLEEMPVGGTILKKDPLKSVIDLDYENEKLIDIKNKIAQFNDCLNRPNFQPILNAYNFSANDRHLINYAIVQINGRTGQVEQILNQQLKLKLEDNEKAQTKYKFLHKVLAEMDKNNSNIPEAQNLIDAVFPNLQGDQADAEAFLRGLNLPDSILNIKLLENLYTDSFEDDLNPRITGKEDAFLVRIGYEFGHEHEHALNILPELTQGENKFKLVCVAMHEGTQNGGHYYAYRKHTDGSWWKCNDGSVTKECNNDAELLNIDYVKKHATLLTYVKEQ